LNLFCYKLVIRANNFVSGADSYFIIVLSWFRLV